MPQILLTLHTSFCVELNCTCFLYLERVWLFNLKPLKTKERHYFANKGPSSQSYGEIKRCLLLGRTMINLDSILKNRDITLPTKVHLFKAMVFPIVMCGCESWTIKKAEHQRIDAFDLWHWRRLFRVP